MVKEILVKEGQDVVQGQALIRMDTEVSEKRKETLEKQYDLEETRFTEETRSFRAREQSLRERMDGLSRALAVEREIYDAIVPLAAQGGIERMQVLKQKNSIEQLQSQIAQAKANLQEVQAQLLKMKQESLRELADLERQLVEVEDTRSKEVLVSPVNGVVYGMVPSSPGYAASAGETLVKVVPGRSSGSTYSSRCWFPRAGMPAKIRVDAFPYTQFGSIEGELKSVGTLPLRESDLPTPFPAYLALDQQYLDRNGNQFKISPGQGEPTWY